MPLGTGAVTLATLPSEPYVSDPPLFMAQTKKNHQQFASVPWPGFGQPIQLQLPQVGIISKVRVVFDGTVTVATAPATSTPVFPYAFMGPTQLRANGQNTLIDAQGPDLQALRLLRYPAYSDSTDVTPALAVGSSPVHLTWEYPIALDELSLVGSLYAQSASTNLMLSLRTGAAGDLFATNPGNVTVTGTFTFHVTFFEIPYSADGKLVIPDLSKLHGINAFDTAFSNTGDVTVPLIRSEGTLLRLMHRITNGAYTTGSQLSISPSSALSARIDRWRLAYGGNQLPYDFNPAAVLASINNQQYGLTLPYGFFVLDLVREYPQRDILLLQGVTELKSIATVDSAVTVAAGSNVHIVQETLF